MSRSVRRLIAGTGALAVAIAFVLAARLRTPATRSPAAASHYVASDPARLKATGRPQLIEFYHRA